MEVDTNKKTKSNRISVLDSSKDERKEIPIWRQNNVKTSTGVMIILTVLFIIALMRDSSVYLLEIPKFNDLKAHAGIVEITYGGRRNSYLSLNTGEDVILFTCWIWSGGISDCLTAEQRAAFTGKQATTYSYRALINGVFHENRLLQLEVNGKTIIVYKEQKAEYFRHKKQFFYSSTALFLTVLFCVLFVYGIKRLNNNSEKEK